MYNQIVSDKVSGGRWSIQFFQRFSATSWYKGPSTSYATDREENSIVWMFSLISMLVEVHKERESRRCNRIHLYVCLGRYYYIDQWLKSVCVYVVEGEKASIQPLNSAWGLRMNGWMETMVYIQLIIIRVFLIATKSIRIESTAIATAYKFFGFLFGSFNLFEFAWYGVL